MRAPGAIACGLLLVFTGLSGCIGTDDDADPTDTDLPTTGSITKVADRKDLPFKTDGEWSYPLEAGPFGILEALSVDVPVSVPVGNGLPDPVANLGLFLPDMPGCEMHSDHDEQGGPVVELRRVDNHPGEGMAMDCTVPIIADIGPYYADGDEIATSPDTHRLGGFLISNFVPHGYAVAQVSVLGTGASGGCMDLMGEVEQAGIQAAVEWLGTQPWSNGNVGIIGRSYDGSTPWEAAMAGSEHLKTVVPISGLFGQDDLMWRNGTAETRGPGLLWGIYYTFTYTPEQGVGPAVPVVGAVVPSPEGAPEHLGNVASNTLCPDTQTGGAHAVAHYLTADRSASVTGYWDERSFKDEVLEDYKGSVYFIHGLQDWNVDPHMAFPFYNELAAQGLEMKGLFGQWAHNYPDRLEEHESCDGNGDWCKAPYSVRYDWAQDLLEWFDHYLMGTGAQPELHVEIQDDHGAWHIEPTWPPADVSWQELALGEGLHPVGDSDVVTLLEGVTFESDPLSQTVRIAGLPTFHVTVTPTGPGGTLYAELLDVDDDGRHIGHATMDLRLAGGGNTASPVAPGQPITALMQFEPIDGVVPAGHTLRLVVSMSGLDYLPSPVVTPISIGEGALRLPTVVRGADAFFAPPGDEAAVPVV